jgi:lipid A 3-O-deacylase
MRCRHRILLALVPLAVCATAEAAESSDTAAPRLGFSAGKLGVFGGDADPFEIGVAYRFKPVSRWSLVPAVGATVHDNGAYFVYAEVRREFWLGEAWLLTPSFGMGLFEDGKEFDLGHTVEFRSGLELGHRLDNGWRLGVALFHLSNGGIGDRNPGTEVLTITLSIPVAKGRHRESRPIEPKRLSPSGS